jgi:hypothetical protein
MKQNFDKSTIYYLCFFVVGVCIFLFSWLAIRPSSIRIKCDKKVSNDPYFLTTKEQRDSLGGDMIKINAIERETFSYWYTQCLHENGISN